MGAGYKGNRTVYGSWLMDERALCGLEDVARNIFNYLNEIQDNMQKNLPENNFEKYHYEYLIENTREPEIEILFSDETRINGNSFKEIFDLLEIRQKIPQKILITLKCLGTEVELTLSSGKFSSNYFKYEVMGNEKFSNYEANKNIVIGKIENWIDEYKPDLLLFVWYNLAQWSSAVITILFCIVWLSALFYSNNKEYYFDYFESEIGEIAETGITDVNRDRAIELILLKQYNYVPENWIQQKSEFGDKVFIACVIGVLLCIFIRICPKSNFAIGKGKRRVKFWNQYRKVIFVVIPTVIIIPILINLLV